MSTEDISQAIGHFIRDNLLHDPGFSLDTHASLTGEGLLDSFRLTQLATHLEEHYDVVIDMVDLADLADNGRDSVQEIAQFVAARRV